MPAMLPGASCNQAVTVPVRATVKHAKIPPRRKPLPLSGLIVYSGRGRGKALNGPDTVSDLKYALRAGALEWALFRHSPRRVAEFRHAVPAVASASISSRQFSLTCSLCFGNMPITTASVDFA